jgi:ribosome-binding ATPase
MIKVGLVGLPNVGKSSLFYFFTHQEKVLKEIANRPFATISPNQGIMAVSDERLEKLAHGFQSKKTTPSTVEWVDIAGLVKGAAQGLGLGNEFLSHIREVDLVCHVLRCFADSSIEHVEKTVDPIRDCEIIQSELILADLQQIEKRKQKVQSLLKKQPQLEKEIKVLDYLEQGLMNSFAVSQLKLTSEQKEVVKNYNLLTAKPMVIIANYNQPQELKELEVYLQKKEIYFFPLTVQAENDYARLSAEERKELGLNWQPVELSSLTQKIKQLLNLKIFFTAGPKESRSWLAPQEMNAKQCAGLIHSDISKRFISAQIYNYKDWLTYPNEQQLKKKGKIRTESAQYIIQEGDICYFSFNR